MTFKVHIKLSTNASNKRTGASASNPHPLSKVDIPFCSINQSVALLQVVYVKLENWVLLEIIKL